MFTTWMGYQYQDLQQYHHHHFLVIAIVITSSILGALLHCYLYAVQNPQATVIPLLLAHFTGYKEAKKNRNNIFCWLKMVPFCNEHRRYQSLDGIGQNGVLGITFGVVIKTKDPIIQYLSNIYTPNATPFQSLRWNWAKWYLLRKRLGRARVVGKRGESS